jgi:putative FmdB family regulatory protein
MPIYEYQCSKCGVFEATQRITDPPFKKCPTCKGKVARLVSHSSFILKGSGWYATDYARKGTSAPAESPSTNGAAASSDKSSDSPTSTASASSESKPASKPAAEKTAAAKSAD